MQNSGSPFNDSGQVVRVSVYGSLFRTQNSGLCACMRVREPVGALVCVRYHVLCLCFVYVQ